LWQIIWLGILKMNADLDALKAACRPTTAAKDSEKLSEGESFWIMGVPVAAEKGCIGLSMGAGHSVLIKDTSILEVNKNGVQYFVRVKAGTSALVRHETLTTLQSPKCNCSKAAPSWLARSSDDGEDANGGGWERPPWLHCEVRHKCFNVGGRSICFPYVQCSDGTPSHNPEDDVTE
jgi:hypothetical protein